MVMKIDIRTLPAWVLFFFSSALLALTKGGIKGTVVDQNNDPIEGVKVTIVSIEYPSQIFNLKTDKRGQFIQIGIEPGSYRVLCEKEGFSQHQSQIKVSMNTREEITVNLRPGQQEILVQGIPGSEELSEALQLFQKGKYEEALVGFKSALEKKPEDAIVYYNLGATYMVLEKQNEAIDAFRRSIDIQPDNFQALKYIGQLYGKKENYEEASKYYTRAAKISADDPEVFYNLGVSLMNINNQNEALNAFQKSIGCKKDYADAYYQLGLLYLNLNKMDKARTALKEFLRLAPDDPKAAMAKKILELLNGK